MYPGERSHPLRDAFGGSQRKPTIILLMTPLLLATWKYFGSHQFYLDYFADRWMPTSDPTVAAAIYSFLATFVLLGVLPMLVVKFVFGERLANYGVQWGNRLRSIRSFLIIAPLLVAGVWLILDHSGLEVEYPINRSAGSSPRMFGLHAVSYVFFYIGWEFYFRGFMQFGLRESIGDTNAILVQVACSVLAHIGKPTIEIYTSIIGGLLWGILAFRTRSLLSGALQHFVLGLAVDWFLCFG